MKTVTKLGLVIATIFFLSALNLSTARAEETEAVCTPVYGGGEICGSKTPEIVDTAGEADLLFSLSAILYSTGLGSFILAKKVNHLVPFLD